MTGTTTLLLITHAAATWYLVGLCWLVQRVQYPLMASVGAPHFTAYEQAHVVRIGPVVGPVMVAELVTAAALVLSGDAEFRTPTFLVGAGLVVAIWISTFGVQVPLHDTLTGGFDASAHASLVRTNWFRTLAWTARGGIVGLTLAALLQKGAA